MNVKWVALHIIYCSCLFNLWHAVVFDIPRRVLTIQINQDDWRSTAVSLREALHAPAFVFRSMSLSFRNCSFSAMKETDIIISILEQNNC